MAQAQAIHRQELEKVVVSGNDRRATEGLHIGGAIATLVIAMGFVLVLTGHSVGGYATIIGETVTLAGVYVYGRSQQRKERVQKAANAPPPGAVRQPTLPFGQGAGGESVTPSDP